MHTCCRDFFDPAERLFALRALCLVLVSREVRAREERLARRKARRQARRHAVVEAGTEARPKADMEAGTETGGARNEK